MENNEDQQRVLSLEERVEIWLEDCYHPNSSRSMMEKNSEAYKLLSEFIKSQIEPKREN